MNRMQIAAFVGTLLLSTATLASGTGYRVVYNGGSIQSLKAGETVKLRIDAKSVRLMEGGADMAAIPTGAINEISYRDEAMMRRADSLGLAISGAPDADEMLLRTTQRSVILTWAQGDKRGGLSVQCAPAECAVVLAALQGVTDLSAASLN